MDRKPILPQTVSEILERRRRPTSARKKDMDAVQAAVEHLEHVLKDVEYDLADADALVVAEIRAAVRHLGHVGE